MNKNNNKDKCTWEKLNTRDRLRVLQIRIGLKKKKIEIAYKENKPKAEIEKLEKELNNLTVQFARLVELEKKNKPVVETRTDNNAKWIIGISAPFWLELLPQ